VADDDKVTVTSEMVQAIYSRINFVYHDDSGIAEGLAEVLAAAEQQLYDRAEESMQRYFDKVTTSRGDALRRADDAERELERVKQTSEAYRLSSIEHAEEVAERDAELATERERVARLARVIEELGGELLSEAAMRGAPGTWRCNSVERCFREDGHEGRHGFAGTVSGSNRPGGEG